MRIYNNVSAMSAYRNLSSTDNAISKSMSRLSSGLRINSAADDAVGLGVSEKMRNQIRGMNQAVRNAQDGQSLLQTAESAMGQQHEILQRMRELALQSNNDTLTSSDKTAIKDEMDQLKNQIGDIATNTKFNGKALLTQSNNGDVLDSTTTNTAMVAADTSKLFMDGKVGDGSAVSETVSIDVSNADAAYTSDLQLEFNNVDADTGELTLYYNKGQDDEIAQTIAFDVAEVTADTTHKLNTDESLNFDKFGIKVDIAQDQQLNVGVAGALSFTAAPSGGVTADFQIGSENGQTLQVAIDDMSKTSLGSSYNGGTGGDTVANLDAIDVTNTGQEFEDVLGVIDQAISDVSSGRSELGAAMNRLDYTMNNLKSSAENLQASESRIRDLDMAQEMMTFTRNNILSQASTAMLAQANQKPQSVLQLLG